MNSKTVSIPVILITFFGASVLLVPISESHAYAVVELNAADGSQVCPAYIQGVNTNPGEWNAKTLTCTLVGILTQSPTLCISSKVFVGGCALKSIDLLIIDSKVTLRIINDTGMELDSNLVNYGTVYDNYGVWVNGILVNYGTIDSNAIDNQVQALGGITNNAGGTLESRYIVNYGTIKNLGMIKVDSYQDADCCGYISGNLTNFVTLVHGMGKTSIANVTYPVRHSPKDTVDVSIRDSSGTRGSVTFGLYGSVQPIGTGSSSLVNPSFFGVSVKGITDGKAQICFSGSEITFQYVIQYWNGSGWKNLARQTFTGPGTVCGNEPISRLSGGLMATGLSKTA